MAIATESFHAILERAKSGKLQLPEFQRDYVWVRAQVIDLFDSLRQRFPIGALLFMERNPEVEIVPRPFVGTEDVANTVNPDAFVLDGQQRITSGLAIYYGLGNSQFYLDLDQLFKLFNEMGGSAASASDIRRFLDDLDPDDAYCIGRMRRANPLDLLRRHQLYTGILHDTLATNEALRSYLKLYPERTEFIENVVRDAFKLGAEVQVPVTMVERDRPVEAISRIFTTLNTTGKTLNSFELVVAILYPANIRLRSDIDENRALSPVYDNMDRTGEVYLQTIAMLAGASPKKSQLPKTVTPARYRQYGNEAAGLLDRVGNFLRERLGVGLDVTNSLVPYDSIFAPMALALKHLDGLGLQGPERTKAERKLETWFVASALANRYQEGVHNKQTRDKDDVIAWLDSDGDNLAPQWIRDLRVPSLRGDSPNGAVGRLLRCLENAEKPRDPVLPNEVGERPGAIVSARHHIFPTRWAEQYLPDWDKKRDSADLALNVMTISQQTNQRWSNVDPADQLQEAADVAPSPAALSAGLAKHFLDNDCVAILRKKDKTKADFEAFIAARERRFLREFLERWGLQAAEGGAELSDS